MKTDTYFSETIDIIISALIEQGYSPLDQLLGYIEDYNSTYITRHKNARELIETLDKKMLRDFVLRIQKQ